MAAIHWLGCPPVRVPRTGRRTQGHALMADAAPPSRTLAERLDRLWKTMHPRGRGEYSYREVAEGIRKRGGPTITATYLWQLRTGLRDDPRASYLAAIADFFQVSPLYFFDDEAARRIEAELDLIAALRDSQVREIALRARGLSPQTLAVIAEVITRARELEGLPEAAREASAEVQPPSHQEDDDG